MIYTDGKPTICSKDTQIKTVGIRDYPNPKPEIAKYYHCAGCGKKLNAGEYAKSGNILTCDDCK